MKLAIKAVLGFIIAWQLSGCCFVMMDNEILAFVDNETNLKKDRGILRKP